MVLVALIGNSTAAGPSDPASMKYPNGYSVSNATFNFEQSVQGNGYHMSYIYAKAGGTAMKNYAHGSGSLDSEATLTYQSLDQKTHNVYSDYNDFYQDCIQFKEDVAMVYAPMKIAVGNGFYAANPLDYSSLLKEKSWVKNYLAGTSMHHEVEYAHALDKELEIVGKEKITKELVIEKGPAYFENSKDFEWKKAGISLCDMTFEVREYLNLAQDAPGVVVCKMETSGKAITAGVKKFEVVTAVNGTTVNNVGEFEEAVKNATDFKLDVLRMNSSRVVQFSAAGNADADRDSKSIFSRRNPSPKHR